MTGKLRIMPLGGLGEVGKNMTIIEHGRNLIVIDAGMMFPESDMDDAFDQIMREAPGRLIIATFASLISRVQQVVNVAQRHNRKITIAGRSMVENSEMARELGYLHIPDEMLAGLNGVDKLPPRQVVILATGSQGEPMGVLNRLATNGHHSLRIQDGDAVLLSSHIPGNEEMTYGVINRLFQRGADVLYGDQA